MAIWQDWEMYVHTWNRAWSRRSSEPAPTPPLDGYFGKDAQDREVFFQPFPPYGSEERRKLAYERALQQWLQWKAEEPKNLEEEARRRREYEEWSADWDRRLEAEREEKRRKKQESKEARSRQRDALSERPAEKPAVKKKESSRAKPPRYWLEFLVAPSCGRPALASWDPANKTYTLPPGVRISSVQEGWEEESQAFESFVLAYLGKCRNKTRSVRG